MSNEITLTLEEKHQIVVWNHNGFSDNEIQNLFPKMFGNRPVPSSNTIQKIMENLRTLGCLFPENHKMEPKVKRLKQKRKRRNKKICESVDQSPSHSTRETAHEVETSQVTVYKVFAIQYFVNSNSLIF